MTSAALTANSCSLKTNESSQVSQSYDVYGIGNALVDMVFEVDETLLESLGVKKGIMTLIEESFQKELFLNLVNLPHKKACGGSAANTMIALAQLGGRSFYSCKVGSENLGDFYHQDLVQEGVFTNLSLATESQRTGSTGQCIVFVTPDADRTMNTFLGATAQFSPSEICEEELKKASYLYIEGYLVASPSAKIAATQARTMALKHGLKTAITFSDPAMVTFFKEGLDSIMGEEKVDIIFCNEFEALSYTGATTIESVHDEMIKRAKTYVITLGSKGALYFDGEKRGDVLAPEVKAIDTNGAGDLFAGCFLYAITHGKNYEEAALFSCHAASLLVSQLGPRLQKEQLLSLKNRNF